MSANHRNTYGVLVSTIVLIVSSAAMSGARTMTGERRDEGDAGRAAEMEVHSLTGFGAEKAVAN